MRKPKNRTGFTLAELLIALAILGVIATFTIPKVLNAQQSAQKISVAKEAATAVAEAWFNYKQNNATTGSTSLNVLEPYINYVQKYTTGTGGDMAPTEGGMPCSSSAPCYLLHSGAVLWFHHTYTFGGTASTNAVGFNIDPDGTYSGSTSGDGKGVEFTLFYSGRLASWGTVQSGINYSGGSYPVCPACDPSWFVW